MIQDGLAKGNWVLLQVGSWLSLRHMLSIQWDSALNCRCYSASCFIVLCRAVLDAIIQCDVMQCNVM